MAIEFAEALGEARGERVMIWSPHVEGVERSAMKWKTLTLLVDQLFSRAYSQHAESSIVVRNPRAQNASN